MNARGLFLALALVLLVLAGAATLIHRFGPAPRPTPPLASGFALSPASFADLPGWSADAPLAAAEALRRSCARIEDLPAGQPMGRDGIAGTAGDWLGPCGALREVSDDAGARAYFETWFRPWRASDGAAREGLFTGYCEAELAGSLERDAADPVPIYARPADLVSIDLGGFASDLEGRRVWGRLDGARIVPYWTRAEIEAGRLGDAVKPLLWVADPIDAHILSIQGSGRVRLASGEFVRVGFDGTNGRDFVGLSRILIDAGKLAADQADMPMVRDWLEAHRDQAKALMDRNPRYVFFRRLGGDGPVGAEGVVLTPGRSLAVDPRYIPLGIPIYLATTAPDGSPLHRLMVAQDTGAAIKGAVRGDVFWGAGETAFQSAGRMKSRGAYFPLLPRQRTNQLALADRLG